MGNELIKHTLFSNTNKCASLFVFLLHLTTMNSLKASSCKPSGLIIKAEAKTSGNQGSCTLLALFLPFLFIQFTPKIHNEMKRLQGKLQQCKPVRLSLTQTGWWYRLQLSLSSSQRPILEHKAGHVFQQPIKNQPKGLVTVVLFSSPNTESRRGAELYLSYDLLKNYHGIFTW